MELSVAVLWRHAPANGRVEVTGGSLLAGRIDGVSSASPQFTCSPGAPCRMELTVDADSVQPGPHPTALTVYSLDHSFTFLIRDVSQQHPIWIEPYGVAVTTQQDTRTYAQIEKDVRKHGLLSRIQQIDADPEESYHEAAAHTRDLESPIWMGISRDVRIFEMGLRAPMAYVDWIQPRWQGHGYFWEEKEYTSGRYGFVAGRGWACAEKVQRRLDDGSLPILHYERLDDDVRYDHVCFVTLERRRLTKENIRGTHPLVADGLSACHAFTDSQQKQFDALCDKELDTDEETVCCCHITAHNLASVPRHAFFKAVHPLARFGDPIAHGFNAGTGFGTDEKTGLVFGISRFNDGPMPQEEMAVLLQPGQTCTMDVFLPHQPISRERADALARRDPEELLEQCRAFWQEKLSAAGRINVPEPRIQEMLQAGFLHLDMVTYGHEPDGTLNATNGAYSHLGSETIRNITFFDSLGLHDQARRCLEFFLEKQHDDGLMQNFTGYMLETGGVLWCLGEHYRYTRDLVWVKQIQAQLLKACDYVLSTRSECRVGNGADEPYRLISGKVADPEDSEYTFMLNGYAYLGLSRAAEMLADVDSAQSQRIAQEAQDLRQDIRRAFADELARGPAVPLGDGRWCPTAAPWIGQMGLKCLFTDGRNWWTHGAMTLRDDLLGPMHLAWQEVLGPDELATTFMLDYHSELLYSRHVSFSQPYYSMHPYVHLHRGEVKQFLKSYYNTFTALADRQTYSFWEHFYHESIHKTAEEAQFLLQTRWMLWLEQGDTLQLLAGVPRAWLQDGQSIELNDIASYSGPLSLRVSSQVDQGRIEAEITCRSDRCPQEVAIRLPHPLSRKAVSVEGGVYDSQRESVTVNPFTGHAGIQLMFSE